jgi:hypothetical protein
LFFSVAKPSRIIWTGHVGNEKCVKNILEKYKGNITLEALGADPKTLLK